MKQIFKALIIMLLMFNNALLQAQASEMNFTLNSESLNISGEDMAMSSTITKTGNSLVWTQNNNSTPFISTFTITGTSGNWDETTASGNITYNMTFDTYQCTLTLSGEQTDMTAILSIKVSNEKEEHYTFNINAISYQ